MDIFRRPLLSPVTGGGGGIMQYLTVGPATTWNNLDKSADLALSNNNRTVTYTGGAGSPSEGVRSVAGTTANQKVYIEHVATNMVTAFRMGFATSSGLPSDTLWTTPSKAVVDIFGGGDGRIQDTDSADNLSFGLGGTAATGDRLGIAFDSGALRIWVRLNGGAWNTVNLGGAQDPTTGTGGTNGFNVVTTATPPFYAFAWISASVGDVFTTNFASTSWVDAAPTGYTQLAP